MILRRIVLAILVLVACAACIPTMNVRHSDESPPRARLPDVTTDSNDFSDKMQCLGQLVRAYRYEMTDPLRIYVATMPLQVLAMTRDPTSNEVISALDSAIKAAILEIDPRRIRLAEAPFKGDRPDIPFVFSLYFEISRIDKGVFSRTDKEEAGVEYKSIGVQYSASREIGFTNIGVVSRVILPNGDSSPLPLHIQLSANARYQVADKKFAFGLFGLSLGPGASEVIIDGRGALLKLMAQQIVFEVVSRYLGVPAHRCLGDEASPNDAWMQIARERIGSKSDTELLARLQESLIEHGHIIGVTGRIDASTLLALGAHAPSLLSGSAAEKRRALEEIFLQSYMRQPVDMETVRAAHAHLKRDGVKLKGTLSLNLRTPMIVIVDDKPVAGPTCGAIQVPLTVGDHRLVLGVVEPQKPGANGATPAENIKIVENARITIEAGKELHRVVEPRGGTTSPACRNIRR